MEGDGVVAEVVETVIEIRLRQCWSVVVELVLVFVVEVGEINGVV